MIAFHSLEQLSPKSVGWRIRKAREDAGLSQGDLGKRIGASRSSVSQWERGKAYPSNDALFYFLLNHDVSSDWILFGLMQTRRPEVAQ